jgi:hypothetical protein
MIEEHECVVMLRSRPESGIGAGEIGTVVAIYEAGKAYEVEFINPDGTTQALFTAYADEVRRASVQELDALKAMGV